MCVKLHTFCKTSHFVQYQSSFFHVSIGKFYTWLNFFTQPAVVMVVTSMKYVIDAVLRYDNFHIFTSSNYLGSGQWTYVSHWMCQDKCVSQMMMISDHQFLCLIWLHQLVISTQCVCQISVLSLLSILINHKRLKFALGPNICNCNTFKVCCLDLFLFLILYLPNLRNYIFLDINK